MSDSYQIDGVTITPQPGGYYDLTHPSLPDAVRERGKEKADTKAREIAAAAHVDSESHMPPQGLPPETLPPDLAEPPAAPETPAEDSPEVAALKARIAELEAAGVRTVGATGSGPDPVAMRAVPSRYAGELDEDTKAALAAKGIKTRRIILDDNESIPPTGLFISHNFKPYVIMPGVPVDVPAFLLGVLRDAVTSRPIVDTKSLRVLGHRDQMKYPFRYVDDD